MKYQESEWWGSENRIERLESAMADGLSFAEIATILGTTRNAVIGKAHRIAFGWQPPPPRQYAFDGLGNHDCRWPIGDPAEPDFHFCRASVLAFGPYCATHTKIAWDRRKTVEY